MELHHKEYSSSECKEKCVGDILKTCPVPIDPSCIKGFSVCSSQCPPRCETDTFSYILGLSNFPQSNYFEVNRNFTSEFQTNHTFATLKQSVLKLSMRYDELGYTLVKKVPKIPIESLIGTLGGTLGCFIGASLLSLVDLFQLVLDIILLVFRSMGKTIARKITVVKRSKKLRNKV